MLALSAYVDAAKLQMQIMYSMHLIKRFFKVTCTLASAIKPNVTTISMEKKRGKNCLHKLFTLFIINIQLNELIEKLANKVDHQT